MTTTSGHSSWTRISCSVCGHILVPGPPLDRAVLVAAGMRVALASVKAEATHNHEVAEHADLLIGDAS